MDGAGDEQSRPSLVVVTTDSATTSELCAWLARQLPSAEVAVGSGFYAAVAALARDADVVVAEVGMPSPRDIWRLAEIRNRVASAAIVVVADSTLLPRLIGPLRADLAVRFVHDLPPLRELVTGPAAVDHQTIRRRSRR